MKKRNLFVLILLLALGFAAVSTTLILNGAVNIAGNNKEFDVYFSNALENEKVKNSLIKDDTHIAFTVDMSLVGDKYVLDYDVTNGSKNYDAELTLNHTESNEYIKITNVFDTETNLLATETRSGKLTIEVIKPYVGTEEEPTKEIEVVLSITANAVERENLATGTPVEKVKGPWTMAEDNDSDGTLSNGDLITLGTESFYIYDIEGDNVKAIAQYNVDTKSTGLQSEDAENVSFISQEKLDVLTEGQRQNDYEISDVKEYVDSYATKLNELDGNVNIVRLITREELESAGCDSNAHKCSNVPAYLKSTPTYWALSPNISEGRDVWFVESSGTYDWWYAIYTYRSGVRPVIEINKSLIR